MDFDDKPDYFMAPQPEETPDPVIRFDNEETPQPEKPRRRRNRGRKILLWSVFIIAAVLAGIFWMRYLAPYETHMHEEGYVVDFKKQGFLFKTWEGQMLVNQSLVDTSQVYSRDFVFSVDNDRVARELSSLKGSGKKVSVTYKRYWGALPWRGATTCIVTGVNPD